MDRVVGMADGELGQQVSDMGGAHVPARETKRLRPYRGVSLVCGSFMAVGSLVQAIHSVEESVAPVRRRRARWQPLGVRDRFAQRAPCSAF
jgi:hypothetical protein